MDRKTEIRAEHLSFGYGKEGLLFSDLCFSVASGEILCILGANGVGKTSLLNCICNLEMINEGNVYLGDQNIRTLSLKEVAQKISFVPQLITPTFDYMVLDYVVTGIAPYLGTFARPQKEHFQKAKMILEELQIGHLAYKSYGRISGGERQQICIARALLQDTQVIILDEPTAHLDYGNQIKVLRIMRKLKEKGYAIIFTTHNPDHALLVSDKTLAMKKSNYAFGQTKEMITEDFLRVLYQEDIHLCYVEDVKRTACLSAKI